MKNTSALFATAALLLLCSCSPNSSNNHNDSNNDNNRSQNNSESVLTDTQKKALEQAKNIEKILQEENEKHLKAIDAIN